MPEYGVLRAAGDVVIDGVLDDPDWAAAGSVGSFSFPWHVSGDRAQTEVKLLWDDEFLYIAYQCDDAYIWADHYSTNGETYKDDARLAAGHTPMAGDMWRIALNRCGGRTNIQDSQWSPARTEQKNFHSWPDFGRIVFSDEIAR